MIFKNKNLFIIISILILFVSSCWKSNENIEINDINSENIWLEEATDISSTVDYKVSDYVTLVWWDVDNLIWEFSHLSSSWNLNNLRKFILNEDFKEIQKTIDIILKEVDGNKNLSDNDNIKVQALKYTKVMAVLNEGNYFYTEKEKSEEAKKIIENIIIDYPYSKDDFLNNYYLWYSKEIIKNYTWALDNYNAWLDNIIGVDKEKMYKSILTNQIWHVYDLKWDIETAYKYYLDAYNTYNKNYRASINIARYLTRNLNYEEAKIFFGYSLLTISKSLKSEIYFSLSSIELELNWLNPDIDKSIEHAKKAIEFNENYSMWYLALARWYYMLNDSQYDKDIIKNLDKSINLNPNWNEAYRYYALYYLDKKDIEKAVSYVDKSKEVIDKDMILMDNQRISFNFLNDLLKIYIWISIEKLDSVYELYNNEKLLYLIKTQLKRKKSWIYSSISSNTKFKKVIDSFK